MEEICVSINKNTVILKTYKFIPQNKKLPKTTTTYKNKKLIKYINNKS